MSNGIDAAHGALSIVQNMLPADPLDKGPTLDEFAAALAHIDLNKTEARRAIAFLAIQVHIERRDDEKRAAADAVRTLRHLTDELTRWQARAQNAAGA